MINDLINIAREAGSLVKEGFGDSHKVDYKTGDNNLVTEIDKASEKLITDFIMKEYPSHSILAEEESGARKDSEFLWVIDPLDGTTNFVHGLHIFSISIGVQRNGETIAGVVYDVMRDTIYAAEKGSGAFANSEKITVSDNNKLAQSLLVTGFPYNKNENPDKLYERFVALSKTSRGVRRLGSAAIDFCYLANGVFDGFWEVHLHPWDICAGKLIVEEAGGLVTDFSGSKTNIFTKRMLATNGKIHQQIMDVMNEL